MRTNKQAKFAAFVLAAITTSPIVMGALSFSAQAQPINDSAIVQSSSNGNIDAARPHPAKTSVFYRYYNRGNGDHFYTTNYSELGAGRGGYVLEGNAGYIYLTQVSGTVPLYRYYNSGNGDHFYTTNYNELGAGRGGYVSEGIAGYIYPTSYLGTVPLYRYYNRGNGDHFYTTNYNELGAGRDGYVSEGIAGYVKTN